MKTFQIQNRLRLYFLGDLFTPLSKFSSFTFKSLDSKTSFRVISDLSFSVACSFLMINDRRGCGETLAEEVNHTEALNDTNSKDSTPNDVSIKEIEMLGTEEKE